MIPAAANREEEFAALSIDEHDADHCHQNVTVVRIT